MKAANKNQLSYIFLSLTLLMSIGIFAFSLHTPVVDLQGQSQTEPEPSLDGKKVLFVYGGWKGHSPKECLNLLKPWMESEGATVEVSDNLDVYTDSTLMKSVDLIIQIWTMGTIEGEQLKGLTTAVRNGAGFAGWHGGAGDAFRKEVEYQFMVGGQWVSHPGGVIPEYNVHITQLDDPITDGIRDFTMTETEHYYMHVDPNVKVLATTRFSGEYASWINGSVMPVVWKKMYGKGRIFYMSLGHFPKDLEVEAANTILKRGFRWASESKYHPAEDWLHPIYGEN